MDAEQAREQAISEAVGRLWERWYESGPADDRRGWQREPYWKALIDREAVRRLCDRIREEWSA